MAQSIGSLCEIVTIKRNTSASKNAYGERTDGYTNYMANIAAEFVPLDGAEAVRRGLTVEQHPAQFTIRWRSDKTPQPKDRLVCRSENYDITSVQEMNGRRRFWRLLAVKVA